MQSPIELGGQARNNYMPDRSVHTCSTPKAVAGKTFIMNQRLGAVTLSSMEVALGELNKQRSRRKSRNQRKCSSDNYKKLGWRQNEEPRKRAGLNN
jgi:hypothetical protein